PALGRHGRGQTGGYVPFDVIRAGVVPAVRQSRGGEPERKWRSGGRESTPSGGDSQRQPTLRAGLEFAPVPARSLMPRPGCPGDGRRQAPGRGSFTSTPASPSRLPPGPAASIDLPRRTPPAKGPQKE